MALQESVYSDTTLSSFSAALLKANDTALLRASNKDQNLQFKGDKSVNISPNDYTSPVNRNLSSLLSQIQDDGPAHTDSIKRDILFNQKNKNDTAVADQHESSLSNDDVLPVFSSQFQQGNKTNNNIWLMFFVVLSVAALLALTVFKLDSRTRELEESLNSYDASLQDNIVAQTQSEEFSLSITNTNETLQSIQQELQLIKTDYDVLDEKYTEFIANRSLPQADGVEPMQGSVGALKHELVTLKNELLTIQNRLITTDKNKSSADRIVVNRGLVVNLASLTNKSKAEEILEQLYEEGLFPLIQQAVVKGKRVYRLSVSGFLNREEAESFIRKAGERYGTKDGRIRKS